MVCEGLESRGSCSAVGRVVVCESLVGCCWVAVGGVGIWLSVSGGCG